MNVPSDRIRTIQTASLADGRYVLYWMIASRRTASNFALDRAVEWCEDLQLPLVLFEPLSCRFPWSSARFHRFVLGGMLDNQRACERVGVRYFPFISPARKADRGLLAALSHHAAVVVTDDSLVDSIPQIIGAAASRIRVRAEAIDSVGLFPFRKVGRAFHTAVSFRRHLQKHLPDELGVLPSDNALRRAAKFGLATLPDGLADRFPTHPLRSESLADLPIDRTFGRDPRTGGRQAGLRRLRIFLKEEAARYGARGDLTDDTHSRLSPYLHYGHIGPHDILREISVQTGWVPPTIWPDARGARHGWWSLPEPLEAFLDEAITWRELSLNGAAWLDHYREYESLPDWALTTLREHEADPRPWIYDLEILETGQTHDPLWNAAQLQLVREGDIHSYMRMLWGKKILEWTASPREALQRMIYLNDAYATDGRDPNSYSGIFWILGRYDHPWRSRPVFGKIRYMSSENTARKFQTESYVARYTS